MTEELDPERLRRLLDAVAQLPRSAEPERDAWPAIRDRIDAQRVRPIAPNALRVRPAYPRRTFWLAAAAVLLITASSALTVLLLRGRTAVSVATAPRDVPGLRADAVNAPIPAPRTPVRPATGPSIELVYSRYDAAASDLAVALDARRARLDPRTVAVLDSCLTRINGAIAEARAALRHDPRNAVIAQLLTVSYGQKLDLLKRAADLPLASF